MTRYENDCCGCAAPGYPCMGVSCPKRNVPHSYCDGCKEEVESLNIYGSLELCSECYDALMDVYV